MYITSKHGLSESIIRLAFLIAMQNCTLTEYRLGILPPYWMTVDCCLRWQSGHRLPSERDTRLEKETDLIGSEINKINNNIKHQHAFHGGLCYPSTFFHHFKCVCVFFYFLLFDHYCICIYIIRRKLHIHRMHAYNTQVLKQHYLYEFSSKTFTQRDDFPPGNHFKCTKKNVTVFLLSAVAPQENMSCSARPGKSGFH